MSKSQGRRLSKLEQAAGGSSANSLAEAVRLSTQALGLPSLTWGSGRAAPEYVEAWARHARQQQADLLARESARANAAP